MLFKLFSNYIHKLTVLHLYAYYSIKPIRNRNTNIATIFQSRLMSIYSFLCLF